jgi:methylated-DNA-[protein]-cysteine S-methyltransferase
LQGLIVLSVKNNKLVVERASMRDICEVVYALVSLIPQGFVVSYSCIARILGTTPRLVAWCLRRNKLLIAIPCHRVVYSDGRVGGYTGASTLFKRQLLEYEGVLFEANDRVSRGCFLDLEKYLGLKH